MAQQVVLDQTKTRDQTSDLSDLSDNPVSGQNSSLTYLLEIASFFADPVNRSNIFGQNLTFTEFDSQLRSLLTRKGLKVEGLPFEKLLSILEELIKQEQDPKLQNKILTPEQLEELIKEAEAIKEQKENIQQQANLLKDELIKRLTKAPVPEAQQKKIAAELNTNLNINLNENLIDNKLILLTKKLQDFPPGSEESEAYQQLKTQVETQFGQIWHKAVENTAKLNNLDKETIIYLKNLDSPVFEIVRPEENLLKTTQIKEQISDRIGAILSPIIPDHEQRNQISEQVVEKLVYSLTLEKTKISTVGPQTQEEKSRQEINTVIRETLKSLGVPGESIGKVEQQQFSKTPGPKVTEVSLFLGQIKEISKSQTDKISLFLAAPLTPEKAAFFAEEFIKHFPNYLAKYSSSAPLPPEVERTVLATVWQMVGTEIRLKPTEIAGIIDNLTSADSQVIKHYWNLSTQTRPTLTKSAINPLLLKEEDGRTLFEKVKKQLLKNGVNYYPESDQQLISLKYQLQAIILIFQGITKKDLENKVDQLLKSGIKESSPQIKELREITKVYDQVLPRLEKLDTLKKQIQKSQQQIRDEVPLFLSRFETTIKKAGAFKKASPKFLVPILNITNKIKTWFLNTPLGKVIFKFFTGLSNFQSKIKTWFLNTPLGRPIKLALEKTAQKSFQALWTASKTGAKKVIIPLATKFFTFLGLGAKAAAVAATNVVGALVIIGTKLIGKTFGTFKKFLSSSVGILSSIIDGMTNSGKSNKKDEFGWVQVIITGILVIICFLVFFQKKVRSGSLINENAGLEEPGFNVPGLPPQCEDPRHYAEEVICVLKACGIQKVTSSTIGVTKKCIMESSLEGKSILEQEISILSREFLQCIGFVDAVQKALGLSMGTRKNACLYFVSPPSNYILIPTTNTPQVGDVAVFSDTLCGGIDKSTAAPAGHITIVVKVDETPKDSPNENSVGQIMVAEANGLTGVLRIEPYPYGHPTNRTDPSGFLRYNK